MKFDYITIPVSFRYTLNRKLNYHINAGPYFSYLVKQEFVYEFEDMGTFSLEDSRDFLEFDFGISAGIGISKNLGTNWLLSLEVRENLGLADIYDPVPEDGYVIYQDTESLTMYTNAISIMIGAGYRFK